MGTGCHSYETGGEHPACVRAKPVQVILMKRAGNTLPAFELNLFKNCLALLLLVPTIALFHGYELPAYSMAEFAIVFVSGVIGIAVADTWYLRALNLMGASRTGP
jgi:drug/metabolite transporter (DMT)-like permease